MLSLVKTQGNQAKVAELFAKMPGADGAGARNTAMRGGGLLGKLGGGAMGGPLAAVAKLPGPGSASTR